MASLQQHQSHEVATLGEQQKPSDVPTASSSVYSLHSLDDDIEGQFAILAATETHRAYSMTANASEGPGDELSRMPTVVCMRNLARVTGVASRNTWNPEPPVDKGPPRGSVWVQVVIGHLVIMNTWGFINSFGVFQSYYVESLNRPPSEIAWVGSIQVFLLFFMGTWTGWLTDAGHFHYIIFAGSLLQVLGTFMTSLCTQYWQIFLAQGVCVGLGNGCLFCPMMSAISTYFSKHRSLAIGVVVCGSSTGGLIYPIMVQQLLPRVGFGWTVRALGFVELVCLIICNIFAVQREGPRSSGPIVEWAAFKEISYTLFAIGMFFIFWGVYFATCYISSFALTVISLPYTSSINLILVLNGVGVVGRLIPNHLADQATGPFNMMISVCLSGAVIVYCMIAVQSRADLYVWAVSYGICGSAIQSLFPAVLTSLTFDIQKAGVRMGMVFSIVSFAVLTGPPIAGALIEKGEGRYLYAQLFAATSILIGTGFVIAARISISGWFFGIKI